MIRRTGSGFFRTNVGIARTCSESTAEGSFNRSTISTLEPTGKNSATIRFSCTIAVAEAALFDATNSFSDQGFCPWRTDSLNVLVFKLSTFPAPGAETPPLAPLAALDAAP